MHKGEKKSGCYDCGKIVLGSKAIECCDCGEVFCKEHIKLNEQDHSAICMQCFRKKIHLEVTLEMESETLEASTELNSLKEKLKNSKKDLSNKKSTRERHENQIKINEKLFLRKFENLEKKIEEELQRGVNIENTLNSLELTLADSKAGEDLAESQLETTKNEYKTVSAEHEALRQQTNTLKYDLQAALAKSKDFIPYSQLRNILCPSCKNKIKLSFRDDIIAGNREKESLIQSVLAEKFKYQQKQSELAIVTEKDKACCLTF